jgi:pseudouridine 5'-phosphatase
MPSFPPIRACLFDMDGLLLDTEDIYTLCINAVLTKYERPLLPWSIKAKLQGRPGPEANRIFSDWAQLPISHEEYIKELSALQRQHFPGTKPLPGVEKLLDDLKRTEQWGKEKSNEDGPTSSVATGHVVHIALATSSHAENYRIKTSHLTELFSVFPPNRVVLGDDPRIGRGRGKPLPDIYLLALKTINNSLSTKETPIKPSECLVFEDSVAGIEAGRRAGMRVIWCPHPMLYKEYEGREGDVLAGTTGEAGQVDMHQVGKVGDGWGQYLNSLENFPYRSYGITIPPANT